MTEPLQQSTTPCPFASYGLGSAQFRSREKSNITSSWGVDWSEELIARDLMQNFFDANRKQLDKVVVHASGNRIRVEAPSTFDLHHLFYLGSEKGADDVGQYGEGFKAATVCILRRSGTTVLAASGKSAVVIRLSDEPASGTNYFPLVYDFYDLQQPYVGSLLAVEGAWPALCAELDRGLTHFYHADNRLIGELVAQHGPEFQLFRSTTEHGHIFYRNLRRGDIPNLPIVLVLNKEYQQIEKKVAKDRDRNAFGDTLRQTFYSVLAQRFFGHNMLAVEAVLAAAEPLWRRGDGHPLLSAISDQVSLHERIQERLSSIFGGGFYAESHSHDRAELLRFSELEADWRNKGRVKLPAYFSRFGVDAARVILGRLAVKAKLEAQKQGARTPTATERQSLELLRAILHELTPIVAQLFDEKRTTYTVAATEVLAGELRQGRDYRSKEIFLTTHLFEDDLAHALAVFLHEHSHIFGYDGSRGFTDALTEVLEIIVRQRHSLDAFEQDWEKRRAAIRQERAALLENLRPDEWAELELMNRDELLSMLRRLPRPTLRTALDQNTRQRRKP